MKLTVTVRPSGPDARTTAARIAETLRAEVERELQAVAGIDTAIDPDARRDALERAVRRIWGTTL